jgi:hypothetical protein
MGRLVMFYDLLMVVNFKVVGLAPVVMVDWYCLFLRSLWDARSNPLGL